MARAGAHHNQIWIPACGSAAAASVFGSHRRIRWHSDGRAGGCGIRPDQMSADEGSVLGGIKQDPILRVALIHPTTREEPAGSGRDPGGVQAGSGRDPGGIRAGSGRDLDGIWAGSGRDPGGIWTGSGRAAGAWTTSGWGLDRDVDRDGGGGESEMSTTLTLVLHFDYTWTARTLRLYMYSSLRLRGIVRTALTRRKLRGTVCSGRRHESRHRGSWSARDQRARLARWRGRWRRRRQQTWTR